MRDLLAEEGTEISEKPVVHAAVKKKSKAWGFQQLVMDGKMDDFIDERTNPCPCAYSFFPYAYSITTQPKSTPPNPSQLTVFPIQPKSNTHPAISDRILQILGGTTKASIKNLQPLSKPPTAHLPARQLR